MPTRRSAGFTRHRSRREEELFQVAGHDPVLHQRLVALRRSSPAAYRKELARLVRRGRIAPGRDQPASADVLAVLDQPLAQVLEGLEALHPEPGLDVRSLTALESEERRGRRRPAVLAWLDEAREVTLTLENRSLRRG